MNNPTKTAKGDETTSQASSSSLPIIQPSIQLMPRLSKRFFRCFADKAAEVGPKLVDERRDKLQPRDGREGIAAA
jgi:hypothetical protein